MGKIWSIFCVISDVVIVSGVARATPSSDTEHATPSSTKAVNTESNIIFQNLYCKYL